MTASAENAAVLRQAVSCLAVPVQRAVEAALPALAALVRADPAQEAADPRAAVAALLASIDRRLTEQLNLILHHEDFQRLEGAWRGLYYLVSEAETDETLKIRFLDISKKELGRTLKKFRGSAWDRSPLFRRIYEEEYGQFGGEPYGCLLGDYEFDHRPPDVELLGEMAQIAAAAHSPFLAAAGPALFQMDTWQELANPRDLTKVLQTAEYAGWRAFRQSEDARYLGLTLPRFLARLPYGARSNPVPQFDFEEDVAAADPRKYLWANSAYVMAANIMRAFKRYGWCALIRGLDSGGAVDGLPCPAFLTEAAGADRKLPTEIAISDRREIELSRNGLIPLVHKKNTGIVAFVSAQSLHQPPEYEDPDATTNAMLGARLPYMFPTCRFAQYLKCLARDKVGSFRRREDLESMLNNWIMSYVESNPATASEEVKARRPLAAARVVVEEEAGRPGHLTSKFFLRPHYQLEGLTMSLRLVSRVVAPDSS